MEIKVSNWELYSHHLQLGCGWTDQEVFDYIDEHAIASYEDLIEKLEAQTLSEYRNGEWWLDGDVGNGEWYEGNEDNAHSTPEIDIAIEPDLEKKLKEYFDKAAVKSGISHDA